MKWIACEKSIYKICIKNMCLVLIYSGFYCIIWVNKLRLCLFCIKTDDEALVRYMRKKHNLLIGERTAEDMHLRMRYFLPIFLSVFYGR